MVQEYHGEEAQRRLRDLDHAHKGGRIARTLSRHEEEHHIHLISLKLKRFNAAFEALKAAARKRPVPGDFEGASKLLDQMSAVLESAVDQVWNPIDRSGYATTFEGLNEGSPFVTTDARGYHPKPGDVVAYLEGFNKHVLKIVNVRVSDSRERFIAGFEVECTEKLPHRVMHGKIETINT